MQSLHDRLRVQAGELERVTYVLQSLRGGTDNDAAATLAQLRLGDSLEHIIEGLASPPPSSHMDEVPNIFQYQPNPGYIPETPGYFDGWQLPRSSHSLPMAFAPDLHAKAEYEAHHWHAYAPFGIKTEPT
ncbi:hypothetical protein LTR17_005394 [Elasticomyces elasticus]|nr:hypothetical protein LTR17_005394 [Elasticomyces elasticus]